MSNLANWCCSCHLSALHDLGSGGGVDGTSSSSLTTGSCFHSLPGAPRLICCSCKSLCSSSASYSCPIKSEPSSPWSATPTTSRLAALSSPEVLWTDFSSSSKQRGDWWHIHYTASQLQFILFNKQHDSHFGRCFYGILLQCLNIFFSIINFSFPSSLPLLFQSLSPLVEIISLI